MRARVVAPVVSLAVLVGACGSTAASGTGSVSAAPQGSSTVERGVREWHEARLRHVTGLRRNEQDLTYRLAGHPECVASNLLRSTAEVQSYRASGDVIVTNPDRSAGVKLVEQSPACRRLFAQAMAKAR